MKKRIILGIAALVLVLSCAILPTFAASTNATQGDFLYENRNQDYLLGELYDVPAYQLMPTADLRVSLTDPTIPQLSTHPSSGVGSNNPIIHSVYSTIVYTDENGARKMLPLGVVRMYYLFRIVEGDVITYPQYDIVYSVWDRAEGVATEAYNIWYRFDPTSSYNEQWYSPELGVLNNPEILIYMGGRGILTNGLPAYNVAAVNASGFTVSYPYLAKSDYENGYAQGTQNGLIDGYNQGYEEGKADGIVIGEQRNTAWMNFKSLIFAIFDAPFYVLSTALNFEVFGINIAGVLIGIITLAIVVFILKIVLVRLF